MDKETSTLLSLSETQSGSALGDATQVPSGEGTTGLFQTAKIVCSLENKPGNRRSLSLGRNHTGREPGVGAWYAVLLQAEAAHHGSHMGQEVIFSLDLTSFGW